MNKIEVGCERCNKIYIINAGDIEFQEVNSEARQMGAEITFEGKYEIHCNCGQHIEINHIFYEYPEGFENHKKTKVSGANEINNTL